MKFRRHFAPGDGIGGIGGLVSVDRRRATRWALIGLGAMLLASRRADLMRGYRHPPLLAAAGAMVALLMAGLGVYTVISQLG